MVTDAAMGHRRSGRRLFGGKSCPLHHLGGSLGVYPWRFRSTLKLVERFSHVGCVLWNIHVPNRIPLVLIGVTFGVVVVRSNVPGTVQLPCWVRPAVIHPHVAW